MTSKSKKEQKKERVIYLLLAPNDKKIFIGQCLSESLRETYRKNLLGLRKSTSQLINEIHPKRPCVFVLETINGTAEDAVNLIIVWTKIFIENGFISYNHPNLIEMTEHLYIDTQMLYDERKKQNLRKRIACSNCAIPYFKQEVCEKYPGEVIKEEPKKAKRSREIRMMVSEEEFETISEMAKHANMQLTPYIRKAALNPTFVKIDYSHIDAHTNKMEQVRGVINRVVFTIDATNNYLPRDIELIVNLMTMLYEGENELIKIMRACHYTRAEIEELDLLEKGEQPSE